MEKRESTSAYEWSIFKLLNNFNFEKNKLITHNFKKFFMGIKFKNKNKNIKAINLIISVGKKSNTNLKLFIDHELPKMIKLPNIKKSCQQMKKILKGYLSENN